MKVLQIITKGEIGGAQTHVLTLCRELATQFEFSAIVGGHDPVSGLGTELSLMGIAVEHLPSLGNSLSPWSLLKAVRGLVRILRRLQPDLIHAHSAVASVVARIAGSLVNIPVVYTVHGFGFKPQVPKVQRWAAWTAEFAMAPLTAHMVCVSDHEGSLAKRLPLSADRMTVIPNGVEDTSERARPVMEPVRIVMVARLAAPKRPDLLLQALAQLRDAHGQEVPTTVVGSGPQMPALQALASQLGLQAVSFAGDVSDVPQRLAQHAVFVLISEHEGLPISIIEAMRAGLPIVASDLPGVRELVSDGQQALLVTNDAPALAAALGRLLNSASLRRQMGEGARQRYLTHFTAEQMASLVAAIYTRTTEVSRIN